MGIMSSGGVGKLMSELVLDGFHTFKDDFFKFNLSRFNDVLTKDDDKARSRAVEG